MIAFGTAIGEPEPYLRHAKPGIDAVAEPDSARFTFAAVGPVARTYNLLLDAAAAHEDLEALVLVHPFAEIADPRFCEKIRAALRDPDVGVIGCAGGTGVHSVAWWEGTVVAGSAIQRYGQHGGGEMPPYSWTDVRPAPAEVDTVDGWVLVLSPWAVRTIRFDERLGHSHGYDVDYCRQVRDAGRKVMVEDLRVIFHRTLDISDDFEIWIEGHIRFAEKWEDGMADLDPDDDAWKQRARRAEAEREAARAIAYSHALGVDARILEMQRVVDEKTATTSWRLTAPLRRLNRLRALAMQRREQRRA
jgi:hypothetical protein